MGATAIIIASALALAGGAVAGTQMAKGDRAEVIPPLAIPEAEEPELEPDRARLARQRRSLEKRRRSRRSLRLDAPSRGLGGTDTGAGLRII